MSTVVVITSGATFTVPSDFLSLVSIEGIGAGASPGGGGVYAKITSLAGIAAGNVYNIQIGLAGGSGGAGVSPTANTWFGDGSALVAAGSASNTGGATADSVGETLAAGGNGNGDGGGGAAGAFGDGATAFHSFGSHFGGRGDAGHGGIGGQNGGSGSPGNEMNGGVGAGGGGAGVSFGSGGNGGLYGGGGAQLNGLGSNGIGANGVLIFVYDALPPVDVTMDATEINSDSALMVVNVYTPSTLPSQAGAQVSVEETGSGADPVSIRIPEQ